MSENVPLSLLMEDQYFIIYRLHNLFNILYSHYFVIMNENMWYGIQMTDRNIFGNKSLSQLLQTSLDCINEHKRFKDMCYILSNCFQESLDHAVIPLRMPEMHISAKPPQFENYQFSADC